MSIILKIKKTDDAKDLPLPTYMSEGAAGMDLYANVKEEVILQPGQIKLIPTGIQIELPPNFEAQIRPRSGLALNYGITLLNTPGTIDSDYRGEIKLIVINLGKEAVKIARGQRIAQMVINQIVRPTIVEAEILSETKRDDGGFGHTGI
ncbi:deoxyuridine 5'-triphosphate nucleotidohydrolase [Thermoanaerobacter sp. YS13]|uniref:dUTP diphosphatase n=1 Tax=Thermoanaerobacter sp. YS13 TaxID=1511746 RepID=UPI000573C23E|nr:dUTP diphosphatase [Thermoanaerobacter sp. YS13]KHO62495.1 deoxyuridine 5'-triphosphate nucleotidohydrolase [Thermoanaerobacter sp. YS13]